MATKTITKTYASPKDAGVTINAAIAEAGPGAKLVWVHTVAPHPTENGNDHYTVVLDFDVPSA